MAKFALRKLLNLKKSNGDNNDNDNDEKDIASSEYNTKDTTDDHEIPPGSEANVPNDDIESEERNELFGAHKTKGIGENEPSSTKDEDDDDDGEGEEDLHKMLQDLEILDFDMSDSDFDQVDVDSGETITPIEDGSSIDYEKRLEREEVFSKRYRPSKSEYKELQGLAERLRVSPSSIRITACQHSINEILFGKHSIVLKKGPVSFNNQDCELLLLTDGFIAAYKNVNDYNPLESKYETCQLWSAISFVEVANFGTLKIQMKSGEEFQICCSSEGEDLKTWFRAIEEVAILWTIHGSKDKRITDVFGWQYQIIRKPAYTAAITADMKLMGNPRNLNGLDDYNQSSALHYAIQHEPCNADIVDALLRGGADPNLPDGEGHSAMYYAERNKLSDMEDILKRFGGKKSKLAEMELKGELFGGVEEAKRKTERRREIEQAVKDNKATEAAAKAQSAQSLMSENMSAMIERGERIKAMDNKTQQLNDEAKEYGNLASQLRNQAKNQKWYQFY